MAPPVFEDLGKPTKDVFEKGHILDVFKLTGKNRTCGLLTMKTNVVHKFEDGTFKGDVEANYPYTKYGLTFTTTWNTQNVIGLAAELANKIYPGVALKAGGTFEPDTGLKAGNYTVIYKHDKAHGKAILSAGDQDNMVVDTSLVVGHEGWLGGARFEYDNTEGVLKNHYFALGHSYGAFQAFLISQNWQIFTCNIYQRVSDRLEMGIKFGSDLSDNTRFYNLGCRYLLDEGLSLRAKVCHESLVGLGLEQSLGGCVKLILSCLVDAKKLNEGGHRFGIGVDLA